MFEWRHESSIEIDLSLQQVWNFYVNPNHWPQWMEDIESCQIEGEVKAGSIIKAKIKNRTAYVPIKITDIQPFKSCTYLIKVLLSIQIGSVSLHVVSHEKTAIIMKTSVVSLLVPFLKGFLTKRVEDTNAKCLKAFLEYMKQNLPS